MPDIYSVLQTLSIPFTRYNHPAVFTVEESTEICKNIPGVKTKNLFLRNRAGNKHWLLVIAAAKRADLKRLSGLLGEPKLSFASPENLMKYLGVTPGSVTLLGLINDTAHEVNVIMDEDVMKQNEIQFHPLTNTATLVIPRQGVEKFITWCGNKLFVQSL